MLLEQRDDRLDDFAMGAVPAFHVDVSLGTCLPFDLGEPLQCRLAIAILEEGAGIPPRGPLGEDVDRRIEPHGDGSLLEQGARPRIDEHTPAGRDHPHLSVDQPRHEPALAVAIILFPVPFEQLAPGESDGLFNLRIAVDERQTQPLGQAPTYRRFSYPHQPDENHRPVEALRQIRHFEIAQSDTLKGYTAAFPLGKSAAMSRIVVLIIVLLVIVGGLYYLSTVPEEQPTRTIEVDVPQPSPSGGNAN